MPDSFFGSLFTSGSADITVSDFFICLVVALVSGLIIACAYTFRNSYSKSFVVTLAMLPAAVCIVIMMVSGSIGAGVAVAGTFSLVRFRSAPGSAREILAVFLAMASGLSAGMGYIGYSLLFSAIMSLVLMLYNMSGFGSRRISAARTVRVTIPEDLDYTGVFDDVFSKYTACHELSSVKTTNMGSLYKLTYDVDFLPGVSEKAFIDDLRCRNGNLEISCCARGQSVEL